MVKNADVGPSVSQKNLKVVLLSFVWMVALVLHHSGGDATGWYRGILDDFRVGGVSFFFVVSGYFFVRHFGRTSLFAWWRGEMLKRVRTLAVPYLVWCTIGIKDLDIVRQFGLVEVMPDANIPLWYVKFLLLFCFISPIVVHPVKRLSESALFYPVFLLALAILPWTRLPMKFCFVLSFLMFSFGMGLAFRGGRHPSCKWMLPFACVAWLVLHCLRMALVPEHALADWPLYVYSASTLVLLSWLVVDRIGEMHGLPSFFGMTFFLYCSHYPLLRYLHPFSSLGTLGCFLNGVFATGVCLAVAAFLRRYVNSAYRILAGGR